MSKRFSILSRSYIDDEKLLKESMDGNEDDNKDLDENTGGGDDSQNTPPPEDDSSQTLDDFDSINNEFNDLDTGGGDDNNPPDTDPDTATVDNPSGGDTGSFNPFSANMPDEGELNSELDSDDNDLTVSDADPNNMYTSEEDLNGKVDENSTDSKQKITEDYIHTALVGMFNKYNEFVRSYRKLDMSEADKALYDDIVDSIEDTVNTLKVYISSNTDTITTKIKRFSEFRILFLTYYQDLDAITMERTGNKKK